MKDTKMKRIIEKRVSYDQRAGKIKLMVDKEKKEIRPKNLERARDLNSI